MTDGQWIISGVQEAEARDFLEHYSPWRMLIQFKNGPSSDEYETFEPFNRTPLLKLENILEHISFLPENPVVLDVGFNCGYNSIYMAEKYKAKCVGVEAQEKHKRVAQEIAKMSNVEAQFVIGNAEEYYKPEFFDLVLHLGTLYHLKNPIKSLENTAKSLKNGGWFALETLRFADSDPYLCKWINGLNGDFTNFWALGQRVIEEALSMEGVRLNTVVKDISPKGFPEEYRRTIWIGKKD